MASRAAVQRTGWLAALIILAAGCYPALDWREVSAADGGFAALLPGKPRRETREVRIGTHVFQMTMLSVRVDPFLFGAGYARLPVGLEGEERAALLNHARDALLMNFGPTLRHDPGEGRLGLLDGHPCIALNARPTVDGRALELNARLCVTDEHLYQLVSLAPRDRAADADASLFLGSLKLLR
ncbi:MAG: hypothetical protein ACKVQT_05165 [Burkholderiales bacterium]